MPPLIATPTDDAERRHVARFFDALRESLRSEPTRAVLWQLLVHTNVSGTVVNLLDDNPLAWLPYRAGLQDVGHQLMAAIVEVDEEAYFQMQREARARTLRLARERTTAHEARKRQEKESTE